MDTISQPVATTSRIFADLDTSVIQEMLKKATRSSVHPYSQLCRQGEDAVSFYVILQGQVKYSRVFADDTEILVRILSANECFGMGTLLPKPYPYFATAETLTFCDILRWRAHDMAALSRQYHQISQNALAIVLTYIAEYSTRHASLAAESGSARLARVMIDLGKRIGTPTSSGIDIRVSNDDLGALADVSRFTVSRIMSRWHRRGLIEKNRNRVALLAPEGIIAQSM